MKFWHIYDQTGRLKLYDDNSVGWQNLTWIQYLTVFNLIWLGDQLLGEMGCYLTIIFYMSGALNNQKYAINRVK